MSGGRLAVGVLASGRGSNLRALARACREQIIPARIVQVLSNRPSAGALQVAAELGLPARAMSQKEYPSLEARDAAMAALLREQGVELLVNAGYDRWLTEPLLQAFPDRIINVHPSLLPAFAGGMDAVAQAFAHGVKVTGVTIHLVDASRDAGPIIAQEPVPILEDDTLQDLLERVHTVEHRLLPETVRLFAENRIRIEGGRVFVRSDGLTPAGAGR